MAIISGISRRAFLRTGLTALAALGLGKMAGCSKQEFCEAKNTFAPAVQVFFVARVKGYDLVTKRVNIDPVRIISAFDYRTKERLGEEAAREALMLIPAIDVPDAVMAEIQSNPDVRSGKQNVYIELELGNPKADYTGVLFVDRTLTSFSVWNNKDQ